MSRLNALATAAAVSVGSAALAQNSGVVLTDGDAVFRFGTTSATSLFPTSATSSSRISFDHRINGGATGVDNGVDMQWYLGLDGRAREFTLSGYSSRTTVGTN